MLPSRNRIATQYFEELLKKGAFIHGSFFTLRYMPFSQGSFAVVVSKKVAQTAVLRNKIRRRTYNTLRPFIGSKAMCVFTAKKGAESASFDELRHDIVSLIEKAKIAV